MGFFLLYTKIHNTTIDNFTFDYSNVKLCRAKLALLYVFCYFKVGRKCCDNKEIFK